MDDKDLNLLKKHPLSYGKNQRVRKQDKTARTSCTT